jgi:hypothetical protein
MGRQSAQEGREKEEAGQRYEVANAGENLSPQLRPPKSEIRQTKTTGRRMIAMAGRRCRARYSSSPRQVGGGGSSRSLSSVSRCSRSRSSRGTEHTRSGGNHRTTPSTRSTTSCHRVDGTRTRRLASRRVLTAIRTRVSSRSGGSSLTQLVADAQLVGVGDGLPARQARVVVPHDSASSSYLRILVAQSM